MLILQLALTAKEKNNSMATVRLDQYMQQQGLATSRSQAENLIKLGYVTVDGNRITKSGYKVTENAVVLVTAEKTYVSRAALKLKSVADALRIDFRNKCVLDVGSSTGGFTEFALTRGATKVIAVDVGKDQMDKTLKQDKKIELHEQTDIRDIKELSTKVHFVLIDVSFISLRLILPHIYELIDKDCQVVAMVKPQFETTKKSEVHKGVIKNDAIRRRIFKDFEHSVKSHFIIEDKAESSVAGQKGNKEKFYLLKPLVNK